MEPLVENVDLAGFPGAPFADAVLSAASGSVRDECGWHIAPIVTETLEVETIAGVAILPTLRIVEITEIRDKESGTVLNDWRVDKRAGVVHGLPYCRIIEVDLQHGHEACPPALLPVIADRSRAITTGGYVRQESLGSRSVSYATGPDVGVGARDPLARYRLPSRP